MAIDPEIQQYVNEQIRLAVKTHRHDGVLTQNVYLNQIIDTFFGPWQPKWSSNLGEAFFPYVASTNGTTPVTILNTIPLSIGSVFLISRDTTAGTITVSNDAGTVTTIAKGTVAGVMVGATSLSNNSAYRNLQIVSSTAGNAFVIFIAQYENGFAT